MMTTDMEKMEGVVNNAIEVLDEYFMKKLKTKKTMRALTAYYDLIYVCDLYLGKVHNVKKEEETEETEEA